MISSEWFEQVYNQHVRKLCAICFNVVKDQHIAAGIVQNVFLSLWERKNVLVLEGSIEHYLVRSVKLASLEYVRTKLIHERHHSALAIQTSDLSNITEDEIALCDLRDRLHSLTSSLPAQCNEVFRLSREKGLSNKEIGTLLNISVKTVEAHISKALKHLRFYLTDYNL